MCPDAFFDSQSLRKHENKHKGINQHECPVCQKVFNTKGLCSRHIKSVHEKEKQYACKSCEFKTFHAYSLTAHVQQVHENTNLISVISAKKRSFINVIWKNITPKYTKLQLLSPML